MAGGGARMALAVLDGAYPRHSGMGAAVVVYDAWTAHWVPGRSELALPLSDVYPPWC
jgi:hypothetical protein